MDIISNQEAPPALIRLIAKLGEEVEGIDRVIVDAFVTELKADRAIGAFEPSTKTVIIDLGHCITDYRWMKYGVLYIANVWLNMVVSVFHEFAHAAQLAKGDTTIEEMEQDPEVLELVEEEAMEAAMNEAIEYFDDGSTTPPLREMGWAGEEIAKVLNNTYKDIPEQVLEETEAHKLGAVAEVMAATAALPRFCESSVQLLCENIDSGQGGIKMADRRYLTMMEFLEATTDRSMYT